MDILTHGLLGAALAQTAARPAEVRLATGIGFVAGLLADADVLIGSGTDPLLTLEFHRHFSHALLFIPLGALIAALLAALLLRLGLGARLPFSRLYLFCLLGYSLSGLLDACTSYGTYLLWPFFDQRIAFHIIAIVDPLFTAALLLGAVYAWKTRRRIGAYLGLALAGAYLTFAWVQHERVEMAARELAAQRGHAPERVLVKPTLGNVILWRSLYQHGGQVQVDAIRMTPGGAPRIYPGGGIRLFDATRDALYLPRDSRQYRDVERFVRLSDGFVAIDAARPHILADVRYANQPDSLRPLWGLELDPARPQQHAHYQFYRDFSPENRQRFIDLLLGRPAR